MPPAIFCSIHIFFSLLISIFGVRLLCKPLIPMIFFDSCTYYDGFMIPIGLEGLETFAPKRSRRISRTGHGVLM